MPRRENSSPRDRLLDTAGKLFSQYGFQAVGIDRILAESGVAKMTLYRHFSSKDEMIAAYLERADKQFWNWADCSTHNATSPEAKLLAFFDAVAELAGSPECLGCVFQGASMAFPELEHRGRQIALRHKLAVRAWLADLARQAKLRSPEGLSEQLSLIVDGAWIAARTFRQGNRPAISIARAAKALIDAHHSASRGSTKSP